MPATQTPTTAPGIMPATASVQPPQKGPLSFRTSTLRKVEQSVQSSLVMTAAQQLVNNVLEGTGFLTSVDLEVIATTAANVAVVANQPDAPWSALGNVVLKALGPDVVNLTGYGLYLLNLYGGFGLTNPALSTDTNIYNVVTGVGGGVGGSFRFPLNIPISINDRSFLGLLGNQDRATKYELRTDLAPDTALYSTLPTTDPSVIINRTLNYCTVPSAQNDAGQAQQQLPPHYGVVHMMTQLTSETQPTTGATLNHFLRSIGNTIRHIGLVFRTGAAGNPRSDTMLPSKITFKVGSDTLFSESGAHRRQEMYKRYQFDAPAGVIWYDFCRDFGRSVGYELGDDWLNTRDIANAQFEITWPTFAGGAGQLQIITDSLVIPAGMDISRMV